MSFEPSFLRAPGHRVAGRPRAAASLWQGPRVPSRPERLGLLRAGAGAGPRAAGMRSGAASSGAGGAGREGPQLHPDRGGQYRGRPDGVGDPGVL